jgi:DNA-binding IscR family transcriptional regulator
MTWPAFPKRLQSALKALCCLAQSGREMQSQEIAGQIDVSSAETAKILQLLVWGGFATSRRGSKGGFHLSSSANRITMGEVIDFFVARHPSEPEEGSPVMSVLRESIAPCQRAFARLSLAEVARPMKRRGKRSVTDAAIKSAKTHQRRDKESNTIAPK